MVYGQLVHKLVVLWLIVESKQLLACTCTRASAQSSWPRILKQAFLCKYVILIMTKITLVVINKKHCICPSYWRGYKVKLIVSNLKSPAYVLSISKRSGTLKGYRQSLVSLFWPMLSLAKLIWHDASCVMSWIVNQELCNVRLC